MQNLFTFPYLKTALFAQAALSWGAPSYRTRRTHFIPRNPKCEAPKAILLRKQAWVADQTRPRRILRISRQVGVDPDWPRNILHRKHLLLFLSEPGKKNGKQPFHRLAREARVSWAVYGRHEGWECGWHWGKAGNYCPFY